jgi:hypothetical protein
MMGGEQLNVSSEYRRGANFYFDVLLLPNYDVTPRIKDTSAWNQACARPWMALLVRRMQNLQEWIALLIRRLQILQAIPTSACSARTFVRTRMESVAE